MICKRLLLPGLMAIDAELDESKRRITLTHPDREAMTFHPDSLEELPAFLDWVRPLMPADRAASSRITASIASMVDFRM
mgnify:CR=1 FL=1